jgi:hypothetical protein
VAVQVERYLTPSMLHSASEKDLDVAILDAMRPLHTQGPLDAIVHKLPKKHAFYRQLLAFMEAHPACRVIDSLTSIERVHQRSTMLSAFTPDVTISRRQGDKGCPPVRPLGDRVTRQNVSPASTSSEALRKGKALGGCTEHTARSQSNLPGVESILEASTEPAAVARGDSEPSRRHRAEYLGSGRGPWGHADPLECVVCAPRQCVVHAGTNAAEIEGILDAEGVVLPLVCKPLQSESSHAIVLITNKRGLQVCSCLDSMLVCIGRHGEPRECIVRVPRQCAAHAGTTAAEIGGILDVEGVVLPLPCKPLWSESSHAIVLITNKRGLQVCSCPDSTRSCIGRHGDSCDCIRCSPRQCVVHSGRERQR